MNNKADVESQDVVFLCVCVYLLSLTFDAVPVIKPLQWSAPPLWRRVQRC